MKTLRRLNRKPAGTGEAISFTTHLAWVGDVSSQSDGKIAYLSRLSGISNLSLALKSCRSTQCFISVVITDLFSFQELHVLTIFNVIKDARCRCISFENTCKLRAQTVTCLSE